MSRDTRGHCFNEEMVLRSRSLSLSPSRTTSWALLDLASTDTFESIIGVFYLGLPGRGGEFDAGARIKRARGSKPANVRARDHLDLTRGPAGYDAMSWTAWECLEKERLLGSEVAVNANDRRVGGGGGSEAFRRNDRGGQRNGKGLKKRERERERRVMGRKIGWRKKEKESRPVGPTYTDPCTLYATR